MQSQINPWYSGYSEFGQSNDDQGWQPAPPPWPEAAQGFPPPMAWPAQAPTPAMAWGLQPPSVASQSLPSCPVNPLQAPLAAGILGTSSAHTMESAATLATDLAGGLFATHLAGKTKGVSLAGGGLAIGGSLVPIVACHLDVLGPSNAHPGHWFVRSHQVLGAASTLAVGGGITVVGAGVMTGAAWENAWSYVALVPEDTARALVPSTEQSTLVHMLTNAVGERLIRWPDFSDLRNLGIGEATRTSHMRKGTLGIVVSTMFQNGVGYMSLTGTFERTLWRRDARFVEISDAVTHVTECGLAVGMSVLEKIDMSRDHTQATRVVLRFDLEHPQARATAERIVRNNESLPLSMSPKASGNWAECFFHDLPAGIEVVNLTAVEQTHRHVGGGLFDSVAKYLKMSGLGLSFDGMRDRRQEVDQVGVLTSETTANVRQMGVLWFGTSSQLIFVNAQYGTLHGQSEPVFLGLVLGMQYEVTQVRGTNRNGFLEDFNRAFGLDIPEFEKITSHSGYYVSVRRLLSAADLARLAHLDEATLAQAQITDPKRIKKLLQLRTLLQNAHQQSATGPQAGQAEGGLQPLLLADALQDASASDEASSDSMAIARARVMGGEITDVKTLGALCQWLGGGEQMMQVCVRLGACEKPLEKLRSFSLEYSGPSAQVRACDSLAQVRRRFDQADKLRHQLDKALEALCKDVIGNALAFQANEAVGQKLLDAYLCVDHAIDLDHLTPRQKTAFLRQGDIFKLLPPTAQAHALCLYDQQGCRGVGADDHAQVRRALAHEHQRVMRFALPDQLQPLRQAQLSLLEEASHALDQSTAAYQARTWGPPCSITLPADRLVAASAAQVNGDPLCKLHAYDMHFLVQDNADMASQQADVREAIEAFLNIACAYDPNSAADVTFLNDALAHQPPRPLRHPQEARALAWRNEGTLAMVGNALEGALQDFVVGARQQPTHKFAAYVVLTTGGMSDPQVVVDALLRVQEAVPGFEDEVCVGFLQIKHPQRAGTGIVAGLDTHDQVGHLIESDTQVERPMAERARALLNGMLNPEADAKNNKKNKANAVKDKLHRLTHW